MLPWLLFQFYNPITEVMTYYKSRGGKWLLLISKEPECLYV